MLLGQITDLKSDVPVGAKIEVYDADKKQLIATHESNDESGKFSFNLLAGKNYALSITAPFYIFYSDFIAASDSVRYGQMEKDFKVQKLERGAKIILRNLYFDEGKATIKPESTNELNRLFQLLAKNSKLVIEISGHSDSQGSAPQNQGLWESRAKAVYDYYVSEGIPRERLQVKGYGKTQPIVTDEQIAQLKTKKEKDAAHAKNRRIEVKVITY
jgi:outer membrane protein OmpA-like peptidoglycan-associated protein